MRKDQSGKIIETPRQLFKRVAKAVASVETGYDSDIEDVACQELCSAVYGQRELASAGDRRLQNSQDHADGSCFRRIPDEQKGERNA